MLILVISLKAFSADTGVSGFNVDHFRVTTDGSGVFSLYDSQVLGHRQPFFRYTTSVSGDLVEGGNPATNQTTDLINTLWTNHLAAGLGMTDFINVGASLPLHFYQSGINAAGNGFQTTSLGDLALEGKVKLLDEKSKWLGGAVLTRLTLPTGERAKFTGHGNVTWELKTIADKHWNDFYFVTNLGLKVIDQKPVRTISNGALWNVSDNDRLTFGGGTQYALPWQNGTWKASLAVAGETVLDQGREVTTPVELLAGVQKRINSKTSVEAGFGRGLTDAIGSPSYRFFAGLTYRFDEPKKRQTKRPKGDHEPALFHTVYFRFDETGLTPWAEAELKNVAQELNNRKYRKVIVRGHADTWGEEPYNKEISVGRALAVKKVLEAAGIKDVVVEALGSSKPVTKGDDLEGQPRNRRVEIFMKTSSAQKMGIKMDGTLEK